MKTSTVAVVLIVFLSAWLTSAQTSSPTTPHRAFVDVDGSQLYFEECGAGAKAVVLLHDGVVNSAVWDDVWPAFCKDFHTIRYDRRRYGRSPATKKPYYEADDLASLLHDRKTSSAAIVASSHGGEVALEFALRYSSYLSDLVVVGPEATGFPYSDHFLMRERANSQSNRVQDLIDASVRDPFLIVPGHDAACKRLHDLLTASPQDLTHDDMPLPEKLIFPDVHEVGTPTLILIGSGDIADNQAVAGALVMAIPGSARVVMADTGHLMYLEKPDEFFTVVSRFLVAHRF